jgi:protocatechuate 3,4-dioxygenase beta subunit
VTIFGGQPAAGARVMVSGEGPARMATTDARGRFSITALRAGRYYVAVSKPGYVNVTYGQRRASSQGTPVPLGDGETRDITVQLPRGGVITGMVLDERGEPAVNAFVRVMRFMPGAAERRPQEMGGDNTDDRGIYRIHSLQPGDYAVCASFRGNGPQTDAQRIQQQIDGLRRMLNNQAAPGMRQQLATQLADLQAQLPAQVEPMTGYAPVCFPGSSPTTSTTIPLAVGEEKGGVDLQLQLTQVARIEGTLVGPPGVELRGVQTMLVNAADPDLPNDRNFGEMDERGRFIFQLVPPGRYTIVARQHPGSNMPRPPGGPVPAAETGLWASADVEVTGQDLSGLVLELQPATKATGRIIFQGTTAVPPDPTRTMINVFPAAPENNPLGSSNAQAMVDASGTFTIPNIFPGTYRVNAVVPGGSASSGPAWVVQSITAGDEDVLDMPLGVDGRRAIGAIVVTMTDRIAELSGTVTDEKGKPATEETVLLFPVDPKYRFYQSRRIRTTRPGEDGRYSFRLVPPGDYRLATLTDPEPGSWYDKTVLSELEATSVRVSIGEGEKKVENVRIR